MAKIENVEQYLQAHLKWEKELSILRALFKSYDFTESIKWGSPAYSLEGKNLFGLGAFKNHYAIWLFQGALLKSNTALLVNAQEGKTSAMRQIRFQEGDEINTQELSLYIEESIKLHKEGAKLPPVTSRKINIPPELKEYMDKETDLASSFSQLSPGKQREYCEYISQAKRQETKEARIQKILPLILEGKGLNDKYMK